MSQDHNLDLLRDARNAHATMLRLEGKTDVAVDHGLRVGERVAVLEKEHAQVVAKLDEVLRGNKEVLVQLGELTERGRWGRALAYARDAAALFGMGGMGLWVALQLLRAAP